MNGEEFSKRIETFTDTTIELIMDMTGTSKEMARKTLDIVSNPKLTEEQVVEKLLEFKNKKDI